MATIGLDKLFYATIEEDIYGNENYGVPIQLAKAISASLSVEVSEASLYADDALSEFVSEFKSGKLSLGIDDIDIEAAQRLTGAVVDNNGVLVSATEDIPKPVAVGFRARKSNGLYRYFWLYRVIFSAPSTELSTKGDSISFATPKIEGTIVRRNKPDISGNHPWKVEVDEPNDTAQLMQAQGLRIRHNIPDVVQNWYNEVYEPEFSVEVLASARNVEVGSTVTLSINCDRDKQMLWSYAWFENTQNSNVGGVEIVGANTYSYTTPAFTEAGEYYFYYLINMGNRTVLSLPIAINVTGAME